MMCQALAVKVAIVTAVGSLATQVPGRAGRPNDSGAAAAAACVFAIPAHSSIALSAAARSMSMDPLHTCRRFRDSEAHFRGFPGTYVARLPTVAAAAAFVQSKRSR